MWVYRTYALRFSASPSLHFDHSQVNNKHWVLTYTWEHKMCVEFKNRVHTGTCNNQLCLFTMNRISMSLLTNLNIWALWAMWLYGMCGSGRYQVLIWTSVFPHKLDISVLIISLEFHCCEDMEYFDRRWMKRDLQLN